MIYQHPATGAWVCPCGQEFVTQVNAENCAHLISRIDHERPTDWWSQNDEAILRGEVAKLSGLPRPAYMERDRHQLIYRPLVLGPRRRHLVAREFGAWVVLLGVIALMALIIWAAGDPPDDPGPVTVTPTTYGPQVPTGGVWSGS